MYTVEIKSKSFDKTKQQFVIGVEFSNGATVVSKDLRYGASFTKDQILRNLKEQAEALTAGEAEESNIQTGTVDLSAVQPETLPKAEQDANDWLVDFQRLQKVQTLIDLGVLTGSEAPVVNLKTKVSRDFKPAYINLF